MTKYPTPRKCDFCSATFLTVGKYLAHYERVHSREAELKKMQSKYLFMPGEGFVIRGNKSVI